LSARTLGGDVTFVLGASGHIAGTINSPARNKRSYWKAHGEATLSHDPDDWLNHVKEHPGSWWTMWAEWLRPHGGKMVAARKKLGDAQHKPIEPAPGRYVKERA
jgi:polyhydroxyalkanoate synthase